MPSRRKHYRFGDEIDASGFFDNVADDVHWTVMGTHPLAGVYKSKEDFLKNTFERLDKVLKGEL